MCYRFTYFGADLRLPIPQPDQLTLQGHRYGLVYYVMCLFYCPAIAGTRCIYPWRDGLAGWLVLHRGGLPVIKRSPIQTLTGPGVE